MFQLLIFGALSVAFIPIVTEHLPKEGEVLNGARIKHIWRTGAKIESPERYTAIVE